MPPLVQLYCKRLDLLNLESFLHARPDHVGWQLNLRKLEPAALDRAVETSASLVERLRSEGIVSVLLLHPSDDGNTLKPLLHQIRPDIFLASAVRHAAALDAVRESGAVGSVMVPIGVPCRPGVAPGYDPREEVDTFARQADWYTTDTITEADTPERFGCSGRVSDWSGLAEVVARATSPVIAAGGLKPGNLRALWELCRPAGFDAHTSVCTDGLPDREKASAFTRAVRELN